MFGYITPDFSSLDDSQKSRFRSLYCGLCRTLRERNGLIGSATLSYDLTFLAILLSALYEPADESGIERCITHPFKRRTYSRNDAFAYVADMNIALAYHKCQDNWLDDHSILSRTEAVLLQRSYNRVLAAYPDQCRAIEEWLDEIHEIEKNPLSGIDAPVNSTGNMLGRLFSYRGDHWAHSLYVIGDGLGRFIYMMDAYEDLPLDLKKGSFNPLKPLYARSDFEQMCRDALLMAVADSTQEFELLPIVQDADLLRNVLYAGIWSKYVQILKKREAESKGAK